MASTLTHNRCGNAGYWCSTLGGKLSAQQLARLQGFNLSDLGLRNWQDGLDKKQLCKIPTNQFKGAIGNCMSVNVLMMILPRALFMA